MDSDDGARALEPAPLGALAPKASGERGCAPADWLVRGASALAGAAASVAVWEVGTTLRLARLATDFAFRAPADLVGRTGQMVGWLGGAPPNLPEEVNRALVLRLYRAAVQADLTTARKLFAADVRWRVPGPEPAAGQYCGIAETVPALGAIWRQLGGITAVELRDVVTSSERAVALLRLSVIRNGRPVVLDWWVMLRIDRGQVTEAWGPFSTGPES
jgi:ketosteroid isomerase-like protein